MISIGRQERHFSSIGSRHFSFNRGRERERGRERGREKEREREREKGEMTVGGGGKLTFKLPGVKESLKWEELAWVRHSSTWEEPDKFKCPEAKCREKP